MVTYRWTRPDRPSFGMDGPHLVLVPVQTSHAGTYVCHANMMYPQEWQGEKSINVIVECEYIALGSKLMGDLYDHGLPEG